MYRKSERFEPEAYRKSEHSTPTERYSRIPDSVLSDRGLSPAAKCVYAAIARSSWQGATAKLGQRQIAQRSGLSVGTVNLGIAALVASGHMQQVKDSAGRRSTYILTSSVFASKAKTGVREIVSSPRGRKRHVGAVA